MVRFSDMLGGNGDADDARPKTAPRDVPPPVADEAPDPDAAPEADDDAAAVEEPVAGAAAPTESAQAVLDRLTQYATASRGGEPPAPPPAPVAEEPPAPAPPRPPATDGAAAPNPPDDTSGTGDDILPRGKRSLRNPRGSKRAK